MFSIVIVVILVVTVLLILLPLYLYKFCTKSQSPKVNSTEPVNKVQTNVQKIPAPPNRMPPRPPAGRPGMNRHTKSESLPDLVSRNKYAMNSKVSDRQVSESDHQSMVEEQYRQLQNLKDLKEIDNEVKKIDQELSRLNSEVAE